MRISRIASQELDLLTDGRTACFLGSLQLAAARANKKEVAERARVTANVFIGYPVNELDGFGLRAEISVAGCDDDRIIAEAHEVGQACAISDVACADGLRHTAVLPVQPHVEVWRRDCGEQILSVLVAAAHASDHLHLGRYYPQQ